MQRNRRVSANVDRQGVTCLRGWPGGRVGPSFAINHQPSTLNQFHSFDGQHRRVTRTVKEWTAGGWDDIETIQFIYEGWNVIEEYRLTASNTTLVRNYTWGTDLSGSLQGAGGVGGLLLAEEINGGITTAYHFHYDGNGNVTEITDLNGDSAASYRYDAFGNTLSGTGAYAAENRYRFSTKPLDSEVTNAPLYYYAYRYYDPVTGRWPSRDPIEEEGGINLYGFVGNDGVGRIDVLGMDIITWQCKQWGETFVKNTRLEFVEHRGPRGEIVVTRELVAYIEVIKDWGFGAEVYDRTEAERLAREDLDKTQITTKAMFDNPPGTVIGQNQGQQDGLYNPDCTKTCYKGDI